MLTKGNRISEKMIKYVITYAQNLGFAEVYLIIDHANLYEKYGFVKIDEKKDLWGNHEKFMNILS